MDGEGILKAYQAELDCEVRWWIEITQNRTQYRVLLVHAFLFCSFTTVALQVTHVNDFKTLKA